MENNQNKEVILRVKHLKQFFRMGRAKLKAVNDISFDLIDMLKYLPVSFFYIASMVIGYKGLRYLELSISSPIQNCSGVITSILLFVIFRDSLALLDVIGIIVIGVGVTFLSVLE